MRLPIVPLLIAVTLLTGVIYLFNATAPDRRILDVPRLTRLADIDGTETEVAITPDGDRCAVVAAGDLWLLRLSNGSRRQITQTPEAESFPSWTPDGRRFTFTRGADTFVLDPENGSATLLKANATSLSWSPTGRIAFVRDQALWLADPNGQNERQIVEADTNPDIDIHAPRFSPDSVQLAFIKGQLGLRGEVWTVDVLSGAARSLVADRAAENPLDLGWILDGRELVYLTNRAGAYSIWHIDFAESTILPLTQPMVGVPLERIGMAVWKDRIVMPRHFVDSDIMLSDGTTIAGTENVEFEPAVSPDGRRVAYTIEKDNKFEIWTASITGENATFRTLGREPRFSPSDFELVFTHTDLNGNEDIWKIDIRNGRAERMTDADEIDIAADYSPDGRSIAFSSARGGPLSVWTIASVGGKRLRINDGGYAPRYSPDGRSILFWDKQALWSMAADGSHRQQLRDGIPRPVPAVWTKNGPAVFLDSKVQPVWPRFDVLPDGRWVVAPIQIRETGLWAIDLTYKEN